jgi:ATP-dependent Clp protease adaptor protein ClpS
MSSNNQEEGKVLTQIRVKRPPRFKVIIHNDDYILMEFVVMIIQRVFHLSPAKATRLMLAIHKTGIGIAGVYSREIAETKVETVLFLASEAQHPLQCTMEPE